MAELGTILGVWAHPDDESYCSGGLMAHATFKGDRVVVAMATKGEAGTDDPERWPPDRLAEVREQELLAALDAVGVIELVWLGYTDGECQWAPFEEAVGKLQAIFEAVQPDSVLTFPPDGFTGHLDHQAVSTWTTEAFQRSAKPGARLYYVSFPPEILPGNEDLVAAAFEEGLPKTTPREFMAIEFDVPDDLMERKKQALRSHTSQTKAFFETFGEERVLGLNRTEWFRLALEQGRRLEGQPAK